MRSLRGIKRASEDDFKGIYDDDIAEKVNSVVKSYFIVPLLINKMLLLRYQANVIKER